MLCPKKPAVTIDPEDRNPAPAAVVETRVEVEDGVTNTVNVDVDVGWAALNIGATDEDVGMANENVGVEVL